MYLRLFASASLVALLGISTGPAQAATNSKVEILSTGDASLVFLTANGIRHRVENAAAWADVSTWFVKGSNTARVQAVDRSGQMSFNLTVRVNGKVVADLNCQKGPCKTNPGGVIYDQPLKLSSLVLPSAQTLSITSNVTGQIYLNDEYTGKTSPASFKLAQGNYTVGLGVATDNDAAGTYSGSYFEKKATLGSSKLSLPFDTSALTPITNGNVVKVAILPVKTATSPALNAINRPGVLTSAMVNKFVTQVEATRAKWLKPMSYGLADWKVTVLPMNTSLPLYAENTAAIIDDAGAYVNRNYPTLYSSYDVVLVLHSSNDARGVEIAEMEPRWGTAGNGRVMSFSSSVWWTGIAASTPVPAILHEFLHTYESPNYIARNYVGVDGLHGAERHGFDSYPGGDRDWNKWYRNFIRSQAGEDAKMLSGSTGTPQAYTTPLFPAPFYVGLFRSMRYDLPTATP